MKVEHTLFSLPLIFAGAVLGAGGRPSPRSFLLIFTAGFGARIVALTLNRIIDARIDALNPRTAGREIPSGTMTYGEAWVLALFGGAIYAFSAWLLSDLCLRLSWIPVVLFAIYPYLKRFTRWSHVFLGFVWSLGPLAGHLAVRPSFQEFWPVLILAAFSLFWLAGFDIIYATMDEEFDRDYGLYSLPAALGSERALQVSGVFHGLAFSFLALLYLSSLAGPLAVLLLVSSGVLLYLEHRFAKNVELAFFQMNVATGFLVLGLVVFGV